MQKGSLKIEGNNAHIICGKRKCNATRYFPSQNGSLQQEEAEKNLADEGWRQRKRGWICNFHFRDKKRRKEFRRKKAKRLKYFKASR